MSFYLINEYETRSLHVWSSWDSSRPTFRSLAAFAAGLRGVPGVAGAATAAGLFRELEPLLLRPRMEDFGSNGRRKKGDFNG